MESLRPLAPPGTTSQVLPVTGIIFVSYLGFVQITSVAEEIKDPGRNLPLAVLGSVVIVTVVYALFLVVLLAAVPTTRPRSSTPLDSSSGSTRCSASRWARSVPACS